MGWTTIDEKAKALLVADILDVMNQAAKQGETEVPHTVIVNALRGGNRGRYHLKSGHRWRGFTNSLDYRNKSFNQQEFFTEVAGLLMRRVRNQDGTLRQTLYRLP